MRPVSLVYLAAGIALFFAAGPPASGQELSNKFHGRPAMADTQTSAGTTTGKAVSSDDGKTWKTIKKVPGYHEFHNGWTPALALADGDMLSAITVPSTPLKDFKAPKPVGQDQSSYNFTRNRYLAESLPDDLAAETDFPGAVKG